MDNTTFAKELNSIIGITMRQRQLSKDDYQQSMLALVVKWLNRSRQAIRQGRRALAVSDFRVALALLRRAKAPSPFKTAA